jgi:HicB_like antitoxin of bacterial toxin-antitoxin system
MGRTLDEALQHAMEAASEWAQAVPAPPPRLLEALRDDPDVKAALADGAVLAIVPLILEGGKPAKANISLDARTLQAIDEGPAAHGLTRSAFMASAALEKIRRGT